MKSKLGTSKQIDASVDRFSRSSRYRMLAFLAAVLALTAISTHGALDNLADELLTETTAETFGLYLVARGINAAVSVFQSAEVNAVVGSLSVGEALDPVNDAVERFSSIMVLAIGSLLLQEVVLAFVSSAVFRWMFALVGIVTLLTLAVVWRRGVVGAPGLGPLDRFFGAAVKIFVIASIVRFIVPVFVVVSYLASQALLQPEIDRQSGELSAISEEVSIDGQQVLDELAVDGNGQANQQGGIQAVEEQRGFINRLRGAVDRVLPDIRMPDFSILPALLDRAAQLAEYLTRLLVLIAVKNVLLPLVFLALALKVVKPFTTRLLAMTSAIDRDLNDIGQQAKEIRREASSALPKPSA